MVRNPRYVIRLPALDPHRTGQDQAWLVLHTADGDKRIRFHDYAAIYAYPGLYEQLFYDRLKCTSPTVVVNLLERVVHAAGGVFTELRVLDFGAGNGMIAEELQRTGVARVVGVDILPEARDAAERDRPGVYDAYHVADLASPSPEVLAELQEWRFDCLVSVAALGFGDIPTSAFRNALALVESGGWIAFNVKETFLRPTDVTGFSRLVRDLLLDEGFELHHVERYRHRLSIDGRPLFYYAIVARKLPAAAMRASDDEPDLLRALWETSHAMQAMSRSMERTLGISAPQRLALRELVAHPGTPPGDLAVTLGIHPSTVTGLVDGLVEQRLVERRKDPDDRRSVRLHPTRAGKALLKRDVETVESVVTRSVAGIGPESRRVIAGLLRNLSGALRSAADSEP